VLGLATWIWLEIIAPDAACPPQLAGLIASLAGMTIGSLATHWYARGRRVASERHHTRAT